MNRLWINQLPQVKGSYVYNESLSKYAWFGVGGTADVVFKPENYEDLSAFLKEVPPYIPTYVLGVGSNLLIRDGGIKGLVVRLGKGFSYIKMTDEGIVAGAATLDRNVALFAADHGMGGFEFLTTIPGTVGGALRMNAGCYGSEIKDNFVWAKALDLNGNIHILHKEDMKFGYRSCAVDSSWIFIEACFKGSPSSTQLITEKMKDFLRKREETQPLRTKTGGSTFRNPQNISAWELIDKAGYRGKSLNGAQISEKHCNFLINNGSASAADLEQLGEDVRERVRNEFGIELHWEVVRLGEKDFSEILILNDCSTSRTKKTS